MRLWHKDLIDVLQRQQLLGQWRECCLIAKSIAENGTPNHLLVNKVMDYPLSDFYAYGMLVRDEMKHRNYECNFERFGQYFVEQYTSEKDIFNDWHNEDYLWICFGNLKEKYDCGGIPEDEYLKIVDRMFELTNANSKLHTAWNSFKSDLVNDYKEMFEIAIEQIEKFITMWVDMIQNCVFTLCGMNHKPKHKKRTKYARKRTSALRKEMKNNDICIR